MGLREQIETAIQRCMEIKNQWIDYYYCLLFLGKKMLDYDIMKEAFVRKGHRQRSFFFCYKKSWIAFDHLHIKQGKRNAISVSISKHSDDVRCFRGHFPRSNMKKGLWSYNVGKEYELIRPFDGWDIFLKEHSIQVKALRIALYTLYIKYMCIVQCN